MIYNIKKFIEFHYQDDKREYLDGIIKELLIENRLPHRQIARLLGVSNNIVHRISLNR